jgi:hypothetical protein
MILDILTVLFFVLGFVLVLWMIGERRGDVLRIARITYRRKPLQGLLTVLWDRRRALPQYAKDFCEFLDAYMREVFPISQPPARAPRAAKRATVRRKKSR